MNPYIPEPSLTFFCRQSNKVLDNIWHLLDTHYIRNINTRNFEKNTVFGLLKRNSWLSIFEEISPIYSGMIWEKGMSIPKDEYYYPKIFKADLETLLNTARSYFSQFNGHKIGVQLSGGLDSSIIICLLKALDIPFYTIGLTCERYEFRTEKYIQHCLEVYAVESVLINYENHLPFTNVSHIPPYQYPELSAINYSTEIAMAEACQRLGVTILFSGDGGDILFGDDVPESPRNSKWLPQIFGSSWHIDFIYKPVGINLIPFFSEPKIMDVIFNLRRGHKKDPFKKWARDFFSAFLPKELSMYPYFADFWGLYVSGLTKNLPELNNLLNRAYRYTGLDDFHPKQTEKILSVNLNTNNLHHYQIIQSRVALAIWLNALIQVGIVKSE
jgi:hypothetical protein